MVVEHDWASGTEKKTMTILCTDANEKMDFKEAENQKLTKDFLLSQAVQSIFRQNKNDLNAYLLLDNKSLTQRQFNMDIGYDIYLTENRTEGQIYYEKLTFPEGLGQTVCLQNTVNSYNIEVKPGCVKTIIFRQSYENMVISKKQGYNCVTGDDELVIKAQREGKRRDRTKNKLIYSKDMHFEDNKGFIIVYKNKTKDQGFSETL